MDADRQVAANHNRRMANEARALAARENRDARNYDAKYDRAEKMIGKLCREGKTVFYAFIKGEYVESTCHFSLMTKALDAA